MLVGSDEGGLLPMYLQFVEVEEVRELGRCRDGGGGFGGLITILQVIALQVCSFYIGTL